MYYSRDAIALERAIQIAPSIAAVEPHGSRSERYAFVPTLKVLEAMLDEGFNIHGVTQAHTRIPGKADFTKHLVRMRKPGFETGPEAPEIVLINSHDGSSRYILMAGIIKFACANGLIVGDLWESVRVRHSGNVVREVIDASYEVVDQFDDVHEAMNEMKAIELSRDEQIAFVESALPLRFEGEKPEDYPVTVDQVLRPRRADDADASLWSVFNRTQESLVRGGLTGRRIDANGRARRIRTREVAAIDGNVKLNKALWTLAEAMADIKQNGV